MGYSWGCEAWSALATVVTLRGSRLSWDLNEGSREIGRRGLRVQTLVFKESFGACFNADGRDPLLMEAVRSLKWTGDQVQLKRLVSVRSWDSSPFVNERGLDAGGSLFNHPLQLLSFLFEEWDETCLRGACRDWEREMSKEGERAWVWKKNLWNELIREISWGSRHSWAHLGFVVMNLKWN